MFGRKRTGWVEINQDHCTGCGICIAVCPVGCLELAPGRAGYIAARYRGNGCRADGICFRACPEATAITVHHTKKPELAIA